MGMEGVVEIPRALFTVPHKPELTVPGSLCEIGNALFKKGFVRLSGAGEFDDVTGVGLALVRACQRCNYSRGLRLPAREPVEELLTRRKHLRLPAKLVLAVR